MPGTILSIGNIAVSKRDNKNPCTLEAWRKRLINKINKRCSMLDDDMYWGKQRSGQG